MSIERRGYSVLPSSIEYSELNGNVLRIETWNDFLVLPENERLAISQEVTPLTGKGFMRIDLSDEQLKLDVQRHVANVPRFVLVRATLTEEAVAFVASELLVLNSMSFYHLGGIMINPEYQSMGLGTKLVKKELEKTKPQALVLRTQSKKMYGVAAKVAVLSDELALSIAPQIYPNNLDGLVNKGVYREGKALYEKEEEFAPFAIDTINWRHGDALIMAGFVASRD